MNTSEHAGGGVIFKVKNSFNMVIPVFLNIRILDVIGASKWNEEVVAQYCFPEVSDVWEPPGSSWNGWLRGLASETKECPPAATRDPCLGSLLHDEVEWDTNILWMALGLTCQTSTGLNNTAVPLTCKHQIQRLSLIYKQKKTWNDK